MIEAIGALLTLGLILGACLGLAAHYLRVEGNPIATELDGLMPGSNCGQCGFPGCSAAANALANNEATVTPVPARRQDARDRACGEAWHRMLTFLTWKTRGR